MDDAASIRRMADEQDRQIAETFFREQTRLRNFIRRRVPDRSDADDILQDVFSELVTAYRLLQPIEYAGAWLFRVARNRITDFFRKKKPEELPGGWTIGTEGERLAVEDLIPSTDRGPEEAYARSVLVEELEHALAELPKEQRDIFIAHEIEGRSFKEVAAETGIGINTLLSRKHYAVAHLRCRLQAVYDEFSKSGDNK